MDNNNRADHIEDYLVQLHNGQWFGWSDAKNKVYANLILHDASKDKPTEQECIDGLATLQSEYDNKKYQRDRIKEYGSNTHQIENIIENGLEAEQTRVQAIKDKYPKENS